MATPRLLELRPQAAKWLPPRAFLPPDYRAAELVGWVWWDPSRGTPHRPRSNGRGRPPLGLGDPQTALNEIAAALMADRVYDSVDELATALRTQVAALAGLPEFAPWQRGNPGFKPQLSGFTATAQGVRRVTILLDTSATHCFICAQLADALGLPPSNQAGPASVTTAATGSTQELVAPVLVHLGLGDAFREVMPVSPMDMDVDADLILGWDWISSYDLHRARWR